MESWEDPHFRPSQDLILQTQRSALRDNWPGRARLRRVVLYL